MDEGWKLNRKVTLLFTVYEEVGHGGSFVPADTEEMISVDMGCVGADLGCTERMVSICAEGLRRTLQLRACHRAFKSGKERGA